MAHQFHSQLQRAVESGDVKDMEKLLKRPQHLPLLPTEKYLTQVGVGAKGIRQTGLQGNWFEFLGVSKELEFFFDLSMSSVNSELINKLRWATQNGDESEVEKLFIDLGSEVNVKIGSAGRTAIHIASDYGHLPVLRKLVQMGANVNATDDADISPLLYAIYGGHIKCAEFLIDKGADVGGSTPDGETFIEALDNLDISDEKKEKFKELLKQ